MNKPLISELPLTDELRDILGRPRFMFITMAKVLRKAGYAIKTKAEDEQAVRIHFMLERYLEHGKYWLMHAQADYNAILLSTTQEPRNDHD